MDNPTGPDTVFELLAHHFNTHAIVVGMTGSGKTGFVTVLAEEAMGAGIPVLIIDVKSDLPNLLLAFASFDPEHMLPWAEASRGPGDERTVQEIAAAMAAARRKELEAWGITEADLKAWHGRTSIRVITPGSTAGEALHLLSSGECLPVPEEGEGASASEPAGLRTRPDPAARHEEWPELGGLR